MAPAALALVLELFRKWLRPLFGKLRRLQIQHGNIECLSTVRAAQAYLEFISLHTEDRRKLWKLLAFCYH